MDGPRTASRSCPTARASTRRDSPEAVVDLLRNGQGVFAIAVDKVWSDLEATVAKAAEDEPGGRRRGVSAQPRGPDASGLKSDTIGFAHASERQFAQLLDFYGIEWEYEPTSFDIDLDDDGTVLAAVHARLLPAGVRPLHRDHHPEPEARDEEEPEGAPAARAVPRGQVQDLLPARLPVPGDEVRPRRTPRAEPPRRTSATDRTVHWLAREVRTAHRRRRPRDARDRSGCSSLDELFDQIPPDGPARPAASTCPTACREMELRRATCARWPRANRSADDLVCFAGGGAYDHYVPARGVGARRAQRVLDLVHALPARAVTGRAPGRCSSSSR